jgi:hypothetical protein
VTFELCSGVPCFAEGPEKQPSDKCGINIFVSGSYAARCFMSCGTELGSVKVKVYIEQTCVIGDGFAAVGAPRVIKM